MNWPVRHLTNVAVFLVLSFAVFTLVLPSVFSARLAVVRTSSMDPTMPAGSLAVTQSVNALDALDIDVGDIIVFIPPWDRDVTISHRVVEIRKEGFVTKGDAVEDPDPFLVPADSVVGKVSWHISGVGYALSDIGAFAKSIWGFMLLIVLPAAIIFGSGARELNSMLNPKERRARQRREKMHRMSARGPAHWRLRRAG